MNLEEIAKQDLIDYDEFQPIALYDPYRINNVLKDTNHNTQWDVPLPVFAQPKRTKENHSRLRRYSCKEKNGQGNDRKSLKMLLVKLESVPSPQKKLKEKKHRRSVKLKTLQEISSTEPIGMNKNKSILIKLDSENKVQSYTKLDIVSLQRPTTTEHRQKKTFKNMAESFRPNEQQRIRNLIKKKLAEKIKEKQKKLHTIDPKIRTTNKIF